MVSYDDPESGAISGFNSPAENEPEFDNPSKIYQKFKEASEKVANWFDKNKHFTFIAKSVGRMGGMYEFEGVDVWWFNEFDLIEVE
jgi:hypothetical protein